MSLLYFQTTIPPTKKTCDPLISEDQIQWVWNMIGLNFLKFRHINYRVCPPAIG